MVFFVCDACGESLKKKQVLQHTYRCRNARFSCIDCQKVFDSNSYASHTKCISEDQKYGGAGYVPKVNKGEVKQDAWVVQVRAAVKRVQEPRLKNVLRAVQSHSNIPRKEAKFINFLQNSLRVRDRELCVDAWRAIKTEAERIATAKEDGRKPEDEAEAEENEEAEEDGEHRRAEVEDKQSKKSEKKMNKTKSNRITFDEDDEDET